MCKSFVRWDVNNIHNFKIFPRFWLVKTTRRIHHNQLLFAKFGKNLCHIESMTSKWRQKCSPLQIIEPLMEKTWGQGCVIFCERKNKERNGETPLRTRKYFEWIIKQLLNSAFVEYEELCRFCCIYIVASICSLGLSSGIFLSRLLWPYVTLLYCAIITRNVV